MCFFFFFFFFFKQKTAYEIMPSLVGSEMCIRDSLITADAQTWDRPELSAIYLGFFTNHSWLTIITTFPVFWPVSTYLVASTISSKVYVRSITGLYCPASTNSFKKITSFLLIVGIGNNNFLPPRSGVINARKGF